MKILSSPIRAAKAAQRAVFIVPAVVAVGLLSACSINRMATRAVADVLAGSGGNSTVFTGDDDPELVGDALPFALKLYESILAEVPDHDDLNLATGSAFVMYANAFVEADADALGSDQIERKEAERKRAKNLYLRGSGYLFRALERKSPGIGEALRGSAGMKADTAAADKALSRFKKTDAGLLYWSAASLLAAYSLEPFDFALGARVGEARLLMAAAYKLDPDYGKGAIDDFYISFYGALPPDLGGSVDKARAHFELAVRKSGGKSASPYVSLAQAVAVPKQDYAEFKRLLETALAVDPNADPSNRLATLIAQRRARALLAKAGDLFFDLGEDGAEDSAE